MTKVQLVVIWIVGLLASAVLFCIGFGVPYLNETIDRFLTPSDREIEAQKGPALDYLRAERPSYPPNYYIGALAPLAILGTCAFLSTMRKGSSKTDLNAENG